jgi:glycosyltransferase involved in cell wall biosynthesis
LADRIREVAASDELRKRLALGAAELSKLFSWASIAENTLQLYERIFGAGG